MSDRNSDVAVKDAVVTDTSNAVAAISPMQPAVTEEHTVAQLTVEEDVKPRSKIRIVSILVALYLTMFLAALDQTIMATSIPTISAALHSAAGYTWIGSAYLLANAATGPIWAKCSDIWGRKPVLLGAVLWFAVGSTVAALSTSMAMLIAARALQGVACGGIVQLVMITISDLFSIRKRALYIGFAGFMWVLAATSGPLLGGAFTQLLTWRWCFWINLPACGLSFALLLIFLDVHNPKTTFSDGIKAIDWFGTFGILAVTLMLLLGLDFGGAVFPWSSPKVICLIVFGTAMIAFFIFSEKRLADHPLIPLQVFQDWSTNAAFLVAVGSNMVSLGLEYYLPLYFQSVKQASPLHSGLLILPLIVTEAIVEISIGFVISKTGRYREVIWSGTAIMTLGVGLLVIMRNDVSTAQIVGLQAIAGFGIAHLFQAPTLAVQNSVTQAETASATATAGFLRNLGTSLSIVLGGVVFQNSMDVRQAVLAAGGLSAADLMALSGDQAAANVNIVQTLKDPMQRQLVEEAFAWSMSNIFILYTCTAGLTLIASLYIKQRHMSTEHTETKTGLDNMKKQVK